MTAECSKAKRMTEAEKIEAGARARQRMREKFDLPPDWPLKYDPVTGDFYYPIDRYLRQLRKRRGEHLFAALHDVIEAERRGW